MGKADKDYPVTPDGRYFVVKGRLWRCSNPALDPTTRQALVNELMGARRALKGVDDPAPARQRVDKVKRKLGERGPVWWTDGAPDENRKLAKNSSYAEWFAKLEPAQNPGPSAGSDKRPR